MDGARQWLRFRRDEVSAARVIGEVAAQASIVDLAIEESAIVDIVRRIYLEGLPDASRLGRVVHLPSTDAQKEGNLLASGPFGTLLAGEPGAVQLVRRNLLHPIDQQALLA